MMKEVIDETITQMSEKLFSLGLSRYQLNDASLLIETVMLIAFRDRFINGKGKELLFILNDLGASGKTAFIDNFIQKLSKKVIEKKLIASYKITLTERLQMNNTSASLIANEVIPEILKSIIERFCRERIQESTLVKMINNGLPLHPFIHSSDTGTDRI
jgi:replicative DNA helicase